MELENKTIIITGAARIGQTVAEFLKKKKANLIISYLNNPDEARLGFGIKGDLSKREDVENLVQESKKKFGRIDALVHMAAIYERSDWGNLNEASFDKNMTIIAKSAFLLGKILGDEMKKNEGNIKGKMIFLSDWSALNRPYKDYLAYNAAKSAVVGLTKSFAKELAPHILINAVAPGPILRPPNLTDKENKEVLAGTLLGRWGGPEEIAKGICYLLESDFVTGEVLTIDGGRTIA
ncbi:MAG: SDR family oxidoreductase [Patescibacteria group bacterium]